MIIARILLLGGFLLIGLACHSLWLHFFNTHGEQWVQNRLVAAFRINHHPFYDYESDFWQLINPMERLYEAKRFAASIIGLLVKIAAFLIPWVVLGAILVVISTSQMF